MTQKPVYLSHVLKLLWDAEEMKAIFNIEMCKADQKKLGILVATDKRALVILENKPGHQIDFKATMRIYSMRLTSIMDVAITEQALRITSKTQGIELFFRYQGEDLKNKLEEARNSLLRKKKESKLLSDIWKKFIKE